MEVYLKKYISQTTHPGSFKLLHSKRLLNEVRSSLDGFKNKETYYIDTDSLYIHNDEYETSKTKRLIGKNLNQSINDYGRVGIVYGIFFAPKVENCFVIDENGIISQKTTFRGYNQNMWG